VHQKPDDFIRYTPEGLRRKLEKHSFLNFIIQKIGGPFDAIAYCWIQALEYLPEQLREYYEEWFYEDHYKELQSLDQNYKSNRERPNSEFPTGFSLKCKKQQINV